MSKFEENILEDERALERFWAKVEIPFPDDPDACYDWNAKKDKNGCGIFCMHCPQLGPHGPKTWKSFRAPRLMWILEHDQPIPTDKDGRTLYICHHCDSETCVNPRHIYLGTQQDNMNDRKLRGRFDTGPKGEKHPNAKLTEAKVRKICHLYFVRGQTPAQIARKVGVTRASIHGIIIGKNWKHVTKTHIPKGFLHMYKRCQHRNEKMYKAFKQGYSYKEISQQFDVALQYTRQILRAKRIEHGDPLTPIGFRSEGRRKK